MKNSSVQLTLEAPTETISDLENVSQQCMQKLFSRDIVSFLLQLLKSK